MNKNVMIFRAIVLALALVALPLQATQQAPAVASSSDAPNTAVALNADTRFKNIYSPEWTWRTGTAGISASGESQPNDGRLDDVDAASQQQRLDYWKDVRKQLDGIDVAKLSPANQVNYAVYREQIRNFIADQQFKNWQMPFNSDSAFWSDIG